MKLAQQFSTLVSVALLCGIAGYLLASHTFGLKLDRTQNNFSSVLQGMKYLQDSMISEVKTLRLSLSEIKSAFPELKKELKKELDIKLRDVSVVTNTVLEHHKTFETMVRDSVITDTVVAKAARYHDFWVDFSWYQPSGSQKAIVSYATRDSCFGALHRKPLRLRNLFSPREYFFTLKNYNPNSSITYNRVIQVEKD